MSRLLTGIAAGIVYLGVAIPYVIAVDTNLEGGQVGEWAFLKGHSGWLALLAAASLAFGWAARSWAAPLLAVALAVVGMPLDYPDSRFGEPLPTVYYAVIVTPISAALILVGVGARKVTGRHRSRYPHVGDLS